MDEKNVKNEYEILKIETGKKPFKKTIGTDLRDLQNEVDGLIEVIYSDDEFVIIANEEGKINGSKPNRRFGNDIIAGDFFIDTIKL